MKILATIRKELLLLLRDLGGLAMIFLMPLTLVTVMALVQDAPFRDYQDLKFSILFVNNDNDSLGKVFERSLSSAKNLALISEINGEKINAEKAAELVHSGAYKAAVIIPEKTTSSLNQKVKVAVSKILSELGLTEESNDSTSNTDITVQLVFDPVSKSNFKLAITNSIEKIAANAQSKLIVQNLRQQMGSITGNENKKQESSFDNFLKVQEIQSAEETMPITNSVQHNVPAWTMFAMFFIVFPLAGNFIKEREDGSLLRLRLIAGSGFSVIAGKYLFYFLICLIQFFSMMLVGIYLLPELGLPKLSLGTNYSGIALTAVAVALAATAYGLLVAVFFKTHHQALAFGSVSVVLLAAIGGVWIPMYVMPPILQSISQLSPMAWGLNACNDLFLRNAELSVILPNITKLSLFGFVLLLLSMAIYKLQTRG